MLNFKELMALSQKPALFTPGTAVLWTDPHIAPQLLATHLEADIDLASYKHATITKIADFIMEHLELKQGMSLLDAGCGPGLYCELFARNGLTVTGLDFSKNSIAFAIRSAKEKGLAIRYLVGDYLEMKFTKAFDAVVNIYQDFCVLSHEGRVRFLSNVHQALKPGGWFILDVTTPHYDAERQESSQWECLESGFWSPDPHLVLSNHFRYPEESAFLNQHVVISGDTQKVYRIYQMHYTREGITALLDASGFDVIHVFEDLKGRPCTPESGTMGIMARKRT